MASPSSQRGSTTTSAYVAVHFKVTSSGSARTEPHPPGHLAGPAIWTALSALLGLGLALAALLPHRPSARLRATFDRASAPAVAVVRGLHNGHIADSVTWLVVGMASFGTALALVLR